MNRNNKESSWILTPFRFYLLVRNLFRSAFSVMDVLGTRSDTITVIFVAQINKKKHSKSSSCIAKENFIFDLFSGNDDLISNFEQHYYNVERKRFVRTKFF